MISAATFATSRRYLDYCKVGSREVVGDPAHPLSHFRQLGSDIRVVLGHG